MCTGSLDPDEIHVPGIYVSRIYQPPSFEKRIERLTLQKEPGAAEGKGLGVRERIVKRAAKELKDGMCDAALKTRTLARAVYECNSKLGVGTSTWASASPHWQPTIYSRVSASSCR
jgi:hypothetical protein